METFIKFRNPAIMTSSLLVLFVVGYVCVTACSPNSKTEKDCEEIINKSLLLHEIRNEILKEHIARYDSIYNEGERGIMIWSRILNDTIEYSIGYHSPSMMPFAPMIKCEPINGREITMVFPDFENDVALTADKALELNRCALSDRDYREFKKIILRNKKSEYKEIVTVINDKVSITLLFDRNQNLIRVDTLGFW